MPSATSHASAFVCCEFRLAWPCPAWWGMHALSGSATCPAPWNVLTSNIRKSGPQPEDHYSVSASPPASKTWELPQPRVGHRRLEEQSLPLFTARAVCSSSTGTLKQQIQKNVCTSIRAERCPGENESGEWDTGRSENPVNCYRLRTVNF